MTKMNADSAFSVKVSFNGEMRRFPFQGTSYAALHEHLLQILGLDKAVELTLKYADEDNDLITISSDLELESAVMPNQVLRLEVAPKNQNRAAPAAAVQQPVLPVAQPQPQPQAQPQPQLQPQAIPAPFMGHGHGYGHGFGHGHGHGYGHGQAHGQSQGQSQGQGQGQGGAEVANQPFGGYGWPHPHPHHYHHPHPHPHPFAGGNDWQAFKELRKHDKKAFTREEWHAFKEQRKKEKKDLKEHFKGQKDWHKKEMRKEWKNWHGAAHAAHHGGGQYFGPNGGAFQGAPTQASPVAAQVPATPSTTTGPQDVAKEVNMTDVPIDDGTTPTPTAPAPTAAQAQSQPASPSVGPFSPHFTPPPFGAGYPPSPFGVPHVPLSPIGMPHLPPPPPFGIPHVPPPPFSFGPHAHPHPHPHPPPFGFPFGPGFGVPPAKLIARHVKDVTIEDGTKVAAGSQFIKTWRVRNEGAPWPAGCALLFLNKGDGDSMNAPEKVVVEGPVATNQEVEISVSLVAPSKPGRYTGYWKMSSPDGRKFGQRMWVTIVVPSLGSSSSEGEKEADRYEALVDAVLAMGFDAKRHRVFRLLQKHDGDVALVCQALQEKAEKAVRKEAKKANHDAEKAQRDVEKAQRKAMKQAEKAARKNAMKD